MKYVHAFLALASILAICSGSDAQTTTTVVPDPTPIGGGGVGDPTCSLSAAPSPDVLVGKKVLFTATAAGGTPGYTYGISVQCTPQNPLGQAVAVAGLGAENTYLWCAGKTGSHTGYASATDSANKVSNQATAAVNVLAPDKLVVLDGDKTVSFVGASATATHTFVLRRGNEDVGGCLVASASERGWDPGTQEPTTWEYTGMSPATSPQFYFQSPLIHDVRYYVKGQKFSSTANGDVVETFKQRVKVDVPKCPNGTTAVESAVLTYEIIRVSATKVRFVVK